MAELEKLTDGARTSLAPSPDYASDGQPDPEICGCEEAVALRERLAKAEHEYRWAESEHGKADAECEALRERLVRAEAGARVWHRVARLKHRLLHERDSVGPASRGVP